MHLCLQPCVPWCTNVCVGVATAAFNILQHSTYFSILKVAVVSCVCEWGSNAPLMLAADRCIHEGLRADCFYRVVELFSRYLPYDYVASDEVMPVEGSAPFSRGRCCVVN